MVILLDIEDSKTLDKLTLELGLLELDILRPTVSDPITCQLRDSETIAKIIALVKDKSTEFVYVLYRSKVKAISDILKQNHVSRKVVPLERRRGHLVLHNIILILLPIPNLCQTHSKPDWLFSLTEIVKWGQNAPRAVDRCVLNRLIRLRNWYNSIIDEESDKLVGSLCLGLLFKSECPDRYVQLKYTEFDRINVDTPPSFPLDDVIECEAVSTSDAGE